MSRLLFAVVVLALALSRPLAAVTPYPNGILPVGASDTHVTAAYNTWKTRRLVNPSTGCANAASVNNGGGNAYSEGVAYGMLMAAYLEADETLLLKLWNFYWGNRNSRNVMNWNVGINNCSNNNANGATDADLDVAAALIRASRRWPASGNNWATKAQTVLDNMYTHYRDTCNGLKNGDAWGGCSPSASNDGYNPSYFRQGYMLSYDCFEGGSRWSSMRTRSYTVMNHAYNNYALPPDWVHSHAATLGQFGRATNSGGYGYDSCRTPWSVGQDYLWWGNATAKNWSDKIAGVFMSKGGGTPLGAANDVGDDYNYSTGAKVSNNHNNEFIGGAAISMMASAGNQAHLNEFYNELVAEDDNSYYSDSLKVIYLMILTGVFQEPCNGGGAPGSPTRTPTRTPSFTASPTPTPAFALAKSASAASAPVGSAFTYYLDYQNLSSGPDTVGVTSGVTLEFHNSNQGASGSRTNVNYRIVNASGGAISLSNYRVRYFHYDAARTSAGDYASYEYNDASGQGTGSILAYSPAYTGGPRNANMEQRIVFAGGTVNNGASVVWEGAMGAMSDSWTLNHADDWSYPGSAGSYSAANGANVVLEQNVAGTWKLAGGAYPGGAAAISNVTISDVLDSRIDYVSSQPAGTYTAGTRTFSLTLASLPAGAAGRITLTAQFNGTAAVGNVVPNSASIGAVGYPSRASNTQNVTVLGAANTPTSTATRTRTPSASPTATPSTTPVPPTASFTRTATASATRSATPTQTSVPATATSTRTASPTATRSATPTQTSVPATATSTRTASPTATRSATPTLSPVPASPSSTPTASATRSATRSASPTATPSGTLTASPTPSATPSSTPSATRSSTPSVTPSFTEVPVGSSATVTPTQSPSFSASPTATRTASATLTESPTSTVTVTQTELPLSQTATTTPSQTALPASDTATPTQTVLPASYTATPTSSVTPSPTRSPTGGSVNTSPFVTGVSPNSGPLAGGQVVTISGFSFVGDSPSGTPPTVLVGGVAATVQSYAAGSITILIPAGGSAGTVMITVTQAESGLTCSTSCGSYTYVVPTATPSATRTVSGTPSPTLSPVVTAAPSATPTPTAPATLVPAPTVPADGSLEIEDHAAWPNPVRGGGAGFVSVKLKGRADRLDLKIYTRAWVLVGEASMGPQPGGWARLDLPRSFLESAPSDAYYYIVAAQRGAAKAPKPGKGTLQVLR